jgi:hypothetical protein
MIEMVTNLNVKSKKLFVTFFNNLPMMNMKFGVGAGAASRYGPGSDQMMRLLAATAPQHQKLLFWSCISLMQLRLREGKKAVPAPIPINRLNANFKHFNIISSLAPVSAKI